MSSSIPVPGSTGLSPGTSDVPTGSSLNTHSFSSFPSGAASSSAPKGGMGTHLPLRSRDRREASDESGLSLQYRQNGRFLSANGQARRNPKRRLKPQYPRDGERHVEYILVASFDIDKGSIMEHQYPAPISGDEQMLAELMMPDGMHKRGEDWTVFFLHKDGGDQDEEKQARRQRRKDEREQRRQWREERRAAQDGDDGELTDSSTESDEEDEESENEAGGEGPPLIYVLNLVNTKKLENPTINRGSLVRAMAICTRHPFLHIYKPLLLLALEDYYKHPTIDVLSSLYDAVNGMDLSLLPRFSTFERMLLLSTDKKNLFTEKFEQMIKQRMAEDRLSSPAGRAKSPQRYLVPRDTREFESKVVYNQIPIPIKVPSAISPETVGEFSIIELIKLFSAPHAQSPQPFALHPHLTPNGAYTHPILVLVNAVLTQKRIIFLGDKCPSHQVAEAVLAACALCSGTVLRGFTRHAFPYTDLTKIDDLLNVPGFIAGVTNPLFASHLEWWDLLCDISTGRMKISSKIDATVPSDGLLSFQQLHPQYAPNANGVLGWSTANSNDPKLADPTGDIAFMEDVQKSIAARHGEHAIRNKWRQYIIRFLRLASAFEEMVYGASNLDIGAAEADAAEFGVSGHGCVWADEVTSVRELAASAWRIEGWRNTRSYYALVQDVAATWSRQPVRRIDLGHQLDRLRLLKLSQEESGKIYLALRDAVKSYDEICQLLAATPENHTSIFYVGLGLFHPEKVVREATAEILERIREHDVGRHYWPQLGRFGRVALLRIQRDMMDAGVEEDGEDTNTGLTMVRPGTGGRVFG